MSENVLKVRIKSRYDTEANWISSNPILLEGEPAYSSDKDGRYKIGDGISTWTELEYTKSTPVEHTHTKSQITDFPTSLKNPNSLKIQGNGTLLTNGTYDGSAEKIVNITPSSIGAAPASHASTASTYGVGTISNYGHVKTINALTQTSHSDGTALSAYQGYVLNTGKATTGAREFSTLAGFITYVGNCSQQTYIGKWKDTGSWGPRGTASWYHGFCVLQNASGGTKNIDGFVVCQSSTNYYIGYVTGTRTASVTWHKLAIPNSDGKFEQVKFTSDGSIISKLGQKMEFYASNELAYGLILGVTNNIWALYPYTSSYLQLGSSNNKFGVIYSTSGTISTSDYNEKYDIKSIDSSIKNFIMGLNPVSYKFNNGTSGRSHYGLIAQDVEILMEQCGMASTDFAGFVKSPKTKHILDDKNNIVGEEVIENEYTYGLRYEEFISPLIKVVQEQENKINNLEDRIKKLEQLLGNAS